jgi:hypothetical protein
MKKDKKEKLRKNEVEDKTRRLRKEQKDRFGGKGSR